MKWLDRLCRRRHCPHSNLRGIYGDEINHSGGYRLVCRDCGARLEGPVVLAQLRQMEGKGVEWLN